MVVLTFPATNSTSILRLVHDRAGEHLQVARFAKLCNSADFGILAKFCEICKILPFLSGTYNNALLHLSLSFFLTGV